MRHGGGRAIEQFKKIMGDIVGKCPVNKGMSVTMSPEAFVRCCNARMNDKKWRVQRGLGKRPCPGCQTRKQILSGESITVVPDGITLMRKF